jgi:putative acetyltransferase
MEFVIRPVRIEDAGGINALRRMPGVFENILGIPSERVKRNEEYIRTIDANTHFFVAVTPNTPHGEMVIGAATLEVFANARMRHSANLGIMVHREYQGMGVGDRLMCALLNVADDWLMLLRVELTVFADNERAIRLYQKHGFVAEGIKRKAAIRNGAYVDELMMARIREDGG